MVFPWNFSDSQSQHISMTLLSILAVINSAIVLDGLHSFYKSSSPFNNPLVTVLKAPIMIGTMVSFMFHSIFQFPSKVKVYILLFTFFQFYSVVRRDSKVHNFSSSLFFVDYYKVWSSGRDEVIRVYVKVP